MKYLINIILLISILLTGCTIGKGSSKSEYPNLPAQPVVVWNSIGYLVTDETISKNSIGKQLGEVKRYFDPNKAFPEKDEDSTIAPVGSKLYEINDVDVKNGFAVEMNGKFRKATHFEP
ncbi:MAG: hypothetical protein H7X86_08720 [Gorillibacterium sp.]|nr:hypothetical protein [Gorillibacterium sp.]